MLGLRFSRLVHAAIASGALALAACPRDPGEDTDTDTDGTGSSSATTDDPTTGAPPPPPPGDVTPPALVAAALVDPSTLQLTFTEPIAPVDTVNPKRFRLSLAAGYSGVYGGQPYTRLADPRFYNFTQYCFPCEPSPPYYYCYDDYYCYYSPSGDIDVLDLVNHPYDPNSALLFLTAPIRPSLCNIVESGGSPSFEFVLHLHYADGGLSQITDLVGLPLPALGKFWVKYDGYFYTYFAPPFANFNPFLPIPCPFK